MREEVTHDISQLQDSLTSGFIEEDMLEEISEMEHNKAPSLSLSRI
jgi:hypothetical protein